MEFGDYISTWLWLLAPDKADATSYLAGNGSQPARYARAVGTVSGPPCYAREYVVGYAIFPYLFLPYEFELTLYSIQTSTS